MARSEMHNNHSTWHKLGNKKKKEKIKSQLMHKTQATSLFL